MPLYRYQCDACGHSFEVIQKFSDAPVETCPKCGGAVHKEQSSPAFQFKGTGWYVTDYAKKGGGPGDKSETAKAAGGEKTEKGEEGKSEKGGKKDIAASDSTPAKSSDTAPKAG